MNLTEAYLKVLEEEKKKKDMPFAKDTDKDDDGKGMDPVGKEDGDIDNDGDKDESDVYLKKRRETIGKAVKKDDKKSDTVEEAFDKKEKVDQATKDKVNKAYSKTAGMDDKSLEIVAKKTGLSIAQVKAALGESVEAGLVAIMERAPARKGDQLGKKDEPSNSKEKNMGKADPDKMKGHGKEQGRWEEDPTTAAKMKAKACYENVEVVEVRAGVFDAFIDGELVTDINLDELEEAYQQLDEISKELAQRYKDKAEPKFDLAKRMHGKAKAFGTKGQEQDALRKAQNKAKGLYRADKRLTKEELELEEAKVKHDANRGDRDVLGPDAKGEKDFVDAHKVDTIDGEKIEAGKPDVKVKSQSKPNPGDKRASEPMKKVKEANNWLARAAKNLTR